jgi:hypothetical protein
MAPHGFDQLSGYLLTDPAGSRRHDCSADSLLALVGILSLSHSMSFQFDLIQEQWERRAAVPTAKLVRSHIPRAWRSPREADLGTNEGWERLTVKRRILRWLR